MKFFIQIHHFPLAVIDANMMSYFFLAFYIVTIKQLTMSVKKQYKTYQFYQIRHFLQPLFKYLSKFLNYFLLFFNFSMDLLDKILKLYEPFIEKPITSDAIFPTCTERELTDLCRRTIKKLY